MINANSQMSPETNQITPSAWVDGYLELTDDELGLILGGNPCGAQQDTNESQASSGSFHESNGNVANSVENGAMAGAVTGAVVGALVGSFGGPPGTMAGTMGGAEVGGFVGGSLAGSAAAGWEVGTNYATEINAFIDGFADAAQEYQNNPPPI